MQGRSRFTKRTMKPGWLLRFLADQGLEKQAIAGVLELHPDDVVDEQGNMPLDTYLDLFEWTASEFDRPHLGIELAADENQDDYGVLTFLASSAGTVAEGFQLIVRYEGILQQGAAMRAIEHDEAVELRYTVNTGHTDATRQDVEFTLASMLAGARTMAGASVVPLKTCFCHQATEPSADYVRFFGDNVEFQQAHNGIWMDYELWLRPIESANPALLEILKAQADHLLSELEETGNFLEHINFLIGSNLGSEAFSIELLAEHLNMTSRTLHRRIEDHGTNFRTLRLQHMMTAARKALRDSEASISDIAQQLGYADSSGFVRVFKRLQGQTPTAYRRRSSH